MKIQEAQNNIAAMLEARGNGNAARETELMLQHVLGCERPWLFMHAGDELSPEQNQKLAILFNERMVGRPLQYLLGTAPFLELDIKVTEDVLIPRPETELLAKEAEAFLQRRMGQGAAAEHCAEAAGAETEHGVEAQSALAFAAAEPVEAPAILDLCTGSGALAAWLAKHFPEAKIAASDVSPWALAIARENCPLSVDLVPSDVFESLPYTYDLIVSNPPYIPSGDIDELQPEVKYYEPRLALDGGADGLDLVERIIMEAPQHLNDGGALYMEIGHDQGEAALRLAEAAGFSSQEIMKDLEGHDRILKAVK